MKSITLKIAITTCLIISASACSDFLDREAQGISPESEFYKTDTDASLAVTGIYDLLSAQYNTNWASIYMIKTMPSDESNAGGGNNGDQVGYQNLDDFTADSQNDKVRDAWAQSYAAIYRANKVINKMTGDTNVQKQLIAEAKTLRAYIYFDLVTLWGDVPLILKDVTPAEYTSITRAPKKQVYDQIKKDLTEAIPVLPLKSAYSAGDKYRVSKGTAQMLLGKAHIYNEEWASAVGPLDALITSGEYSLEKSISYVFSNKGEFGKESIFETSCISTEKYNWGNFPWGSRPESNIHIQLMGPRGDNYTKSPADSLIAGWGFNVAKKKMYDAFTAAGDVERKKISIMSKEELIANGGNWNGSQWDFEGYFQRKYGKYAANTSSDDDVNTGGAVRELNYSTNWRLMRYADALLLAAEAHFKNGNSTKALEYLNSVRQRPGTNLPALNVTGNALFEAIVTERQLELAFEGHRFLDLVRWGRAEQELGPLGFIKGKHEVLPIPNNDVLSAGLKQNNGY